MLIVVLLAVPVPPVSPTVCLPPLLIVVPIAVPVPELNPTTWKPPLIVVSTAVPVP